MLFKHKVGQCHWPTAQFSIDCIIQATVITENILKNIKIRIRKYVNTILIESVTKYNIPGEAYDLKSPEEVYN